jgi:hypothetical protein
MAVVLFIATGSNVGQQISIDAGQTVRIGRTSRSDYAFPNDSYLSGAHFEVNCNGADCAVRDLGSSNGTFVNGARIDQTAVGVKDGDQISAGEMTFLVQISAGELQSTAQSLVASAERTARMHAAGFEPRQPVQTVLAGERKRVHDILMYQTAPLFAVVDATRDSSLPQLVETSALRSQPLFEPAGEATGHAPVLVELGQASSENERRGVHAFLEGFLLGGWGKSWGIFFTSIESLDAMAAHFRRFLLTHAGDERPLHLRLYDPSILRAFLPACEPKEIAAIFGPVVSYLIESDRPETMLAISRGADGLIITRVSLTEQPMQAGAGQ